MIECEQCLSWCHSKCVGMSTSLAASFPYVCPFCIKSVFFKLTSIASTVSDACVRLTALETSFSKSIPPTVQEELLKVTESLQQISSKVSSYPSEVPQSTQHSGPSFSSILKTQPSTSQESYSALPPAQSISTAESRQFNVVLFGVSEQQHGLPRPQCQNKDLDSVLTIVAEKVGVHMASGTAIGLESMSRTSNILDQYLSPSTPSPVSAAFLRAINTFHLTSISSRISLLRTERLRPFCLKSDGGSSLLALTGSQ